MAPGHPRLGTLPRGLVTQLVPAFAVQRPIDVLVAQQVKERRPHER